MRQQICFVYQAMVPFVETDLRILSAAFDVLRFQYRGKGDVVRLLRALRRCDTAFCWFALGHSTATVFVSRLFHLPSVVVAGGWDVASIPEIPYGAMTSPSRRRKTRWTLQTADVVLAVSNATKHEVLHWVRRDVDVVPLGIETDFFTPAGPKEDLVVTAGPVTDNLALKTKGLDVFFDVARLLPDLKFVVVGRHSPQFAAQVSSMIPGNVSLTGWLSRDKLRDVLRRAKVFVQLSAHESFGVTLAEAMACGCAPVVSNRGGLGEVVGNVGWIVPYGDPRRASISVAEAIQSDRSRAARDRVEKNFPLARRERSLVRIVEGLA